MNTTTPVLNHDRQFAETDLPGFLLQAVRREHPEWAHDQGIETPYRDYMNKIAILLGHSQMLRKAA